MAELILIVDDNDASRELLRDVLEYDGFEIVESVTAEDGLAAARSRLPALILMDIQLPGMSGIEALREIRADPALRHIPVVAVTASVMTQDETRVKDAGFDAFQRKPVHVKTIREIVRGLVRRKVE
jgi:two-component system cell cycle response regulator DivK